MHTYIIGGQHEVKAAECVVAGLQSVALLIALLADMLIALLTYTLVLKH